MATPTLKGNRCLPSGALRSTGLPRVYRGSQISLWVTIWRFRINVRVPRWSSNSISRGLFSTTHPNSFSPLMSVNRTILRRGLPASAVFKTLLIILCFIPTGFIPLEEKIPGKKNSQLLACWANIILGPLFLVFKKNVKKYTNQSIMMRDFLLAFEFPGSILRANLYEVEVNNTKPDGCPSLDGRVFLELGNFQQISREKAGLPAFPRRLRTAQLDRLNSILLPPLPK